MSAFSGSNMVGRLRSVLVCTPKAAGWNSAAQANRWQELGFLHAPDFAKAAEQHTALCRQLQNASVEVDCLPASERLSLDAVYTHDASIVSDFGAIPFHSGKANRAGEREQHRQFYQQIGIPVLGEVLPPGTAEAGDMIWLDAKTLVVGRGYRTNAAGIEQIRNLLRPHSVDVIAAPLPHGAGPGTCLHLMSLISLLDEKTALVDLAWLAVETVELLSARGYKLIEIDSGERDTLGCNVLSLGERKLLAIAENVRTNEKLRAAGFDVRTFPGSEISVNGGGGPTCLTRPLFRD